MKTNEMKKEKAITLIALIVTIIVLLILAGVSIAVLTGENGIINRTTQAKKTTEDAEVAEKIRLAFLNAQIGKYAGKNEDFAAVMQAELVKTLGPGATVSTKGDGFEVSYGSMRFDVSSTGVVEKIEGISIGTSLTLQIIDGTKTPQNLSATLNGISGTVTWSKTAGTGDVSLSSTTGNSISVTPESAGSATIKASCSGKEATCTVTVEAVNSIEITFDANGGTFGSETTTKVSGLPNATINLPTNPTRTDYEFKGWYTATSDGTLVYAANATTGSVPASATNNAVTYFAQWKEPSYAFRSYGTYVTATAANGGYGAIGTSVQLNGGNAITVKGTNTIADNWKVFYEDDSFVYLIYGDYYPVNVQTAVDTIQLTPNSSYAYGVNDSTSRVNLLKYLRNYSNYSWNTSTTKDDFAAGGNQYASWSDLQTALSGLTSLNGKTITIQGSPDIELWDKSWVAKGNSSIFTSDKVNSNGYKIYGTTSYKNLKSDSPWSTNSVEASGTGYYDTLYFPYRESNSNAYGYWLASPGANDNGRVCYVYYDGGYCSCIYNESSLCARPVVSIAK